MSAHDSERKRARPPVSSQGIEALLDRWVTDLERGGSRPSNRVARERQPPLQDEPEAQAPPEPEELEELDGPEELEEPRREAPGAPRAPPPVAPPARPGTKAAPAQEPGQAGAVRAARAELRVHGCVVTFPQDDARVVLGREGARLVHRGTVAVRGPCAPPREEWARLGLTEAQSRALEFVLTWFGAPFDAVSSDAQGGEGPRWGAWPLSGGLLVQALAHWKRREPAAFEARLGRLGIDVIGEDPASPELTVLDVERGQQARGPEALALLGEDVRLCAALVRAGRERGAQLAQLECLVEHALHPALTQAERSPEPPTPAGELFPTPRALALLLHAQLRLGPRGTARLAALTREEVHETGGVERAGQRFASALQAAGRSREASEVWRILSTPELA